MVTNNKPWAHKTMFLGINENSLVVPIHNLSIELFNDFHITVQVIGFDLQEVLKQVSPALDLSRLKVGDELTNFSYCNTDCPNITSAYDVVSLGYNTHRLLIRNAEVLNLNPLTLRIHEDDLDALQLGRPQL